MLLEWQYTRSYRTHYIDNGEYYSSKDDRHRNLWEICSTCGPYVWPPNRDGYDLYHKGKKIKHGKTVKELKKAVREASDEVPS